MPIKFEQRKAIELFQQFESVSSRQIGDLFGFKPRTATQLCSSWVRQGFLKIVNQSKKGRRYSLGDDFVSLID